MALVMFENGSAGTFESTRFGIGCKNQNRFEIHGSGGMLRFDLERLNHLEFLDASNPSTEQGLRDILVTDLKSPIFGNFWRPGHIIGYEHTFIATLAEFLQCLSTRRVLPSELHRRTRRAAGARCDPAIGQDAAVDESRSIMNVTHDRHRTLIDRRAGRSSACCRPRSPSTCSTARCCRCSRRSSGPSSTGATRSTATSPSSSISA